MANKVKSGERERDRPLQVRLPEDFVKEVQHYAIDADKSVTQVVQEALAEYLSARRKSRLTSSRG
ncbi:MAG: ribbon-helix-helix protein, CopG family [candidate division NC10 bacterium]|nr:ribbon-helix-helix protein, CopG family [candidate division NC10 bacterium]